LHSGKRNLIQNIAIALLSLSAIGLFTQTQLSTIAADPESGYLSLSGSSSVTQEESGQFSVPVRLAVTGAYGRYATGQLRTSEEGFSAPGALLGEALVSAGEAADCPQSGFYAALDSASSIYYELPAALPLSLFSRLLDTELDWGGDNTVRRLLLSDDGDGSVSLYLWWGDDHCSRCSTGISSSALTALSESYELGGAFFALDLGESCAGLDPLTLFSPEEDLPTVQAESTLSDTDALLSALDFNPRTEYRYTDANGAEVIVEGSRKLRIQSNESILYQGGSSPVLTISAQEEMPTVWEAASGVYHLLSSLSPGAGQASLCLTQVRQEGEQTFLEFEYVLNGSLVRFADGEPAASAELTGTVVNSLSLRFRQYTLNEDTAPLLPRTQAVAIAQSRQVENLSIAYLDDGSSKISASWMTE
jgi:hypothetical protein